MYWTDGIYTPAEVDRLSFVFIYHLCKDIGTQSRPNTIQNTNDYALRISALHIESIHINWQSKLKLKLTATSIDHQ